MSIELITLSGDPGVTWCMPKSIESIFDPMVFDEEALETNQLIEGVASAGRGNTWFFQWQNQDLVLRHYRRGGFISRISHSHYAYTGLVRTRAISELNILSRLESLQLPAPRPFACQIIKAGLSYQASLITYRLLGKTLTECLRQQTLSDLVWQAIGRTIAAFHQHGFYHADLNAHNILIDSEHNISLIDFDRAEQREGLSTHHPISWGAKNLQRLNRSLSKINQTHSLNLSKSDLAKIMRMIEHGYTLA